jgi:cysteine sulfinate desulfinase/cysteine desulfurase-like protein
VCLHGQNTFARSKHTEKELSSSHVKGSQSPQVISTTKEKINNKRNSDKIKRIFFFEKHTGGNVVQLVVLGKHFKSK